MDSGFKAVLQFYDIVRQGCCPQTCGLKMIFVWLANISTITTMLNFPLTNLEVWCNYLKPALLGIKFEYLIYVLCKRLHATPYPSILLHLSLRAIISIDFPSVAWSCRVEKYGMWKCFYSIPETSICAVKSWSSQNSYQRLLNQ